MNESWNYVRAFQVAILGLIRNGARADRWAYKLSYGPKTLVGMALVKLQPNSSLYALTKDYIRCGEHR